MEAGATTLLIKLAGWNGKPNDPSVSVVAYGSGELAASTQERDGGARDAGRSEGGVELPAQSRFQPMFDGQDDWNASPTDDAFGRGALTGYVRDGTLVIPGFEAFVRVGRLAFNIRRAVLVAEIRGTAGQYKLERGLINGAMPMRDFLSSLQYITDPLESPRQNICGSTTAVTRSYGLIQSTVCKFRDMAISSEQACDSISIAIGITAASVKTRVGPGAVSLPAGCSKPGESYAPLPCK